MRIRAIAEKDYALILKLDKQVYPTNKPVTLNTIKSWYQNNPEFGLIYETKNIIRGVCITIPLNKQGWEKLTKGKLNESQLNQKSIFHNKRDKEIGLHIYHIEKLSNKANGISINSIKQLGKIIKKLRKENSTLKVIGFSGLCVTKEGIKLFEEKYNCREKRVVISEHIMEKLNRKILVKSKKQIKQKTKDGFVHKNRCKMLLTLPKDNSFVWTYLK